MKKLVFILCLCVLSSCGIFKPKTEIVYVDRVEYRDSLIVRDSIVYVKLPVEQSTNNLPVNDTSFLETSVAESEAWVDSTGLHHTLRNKDRPVSVSVPVVTHIIVDKARSEKTDVVIQEVEKELTWWQKFRIDAFWWLVVIALFGYRREIWSLIKIIFKL